MKMDRPVDHGMSEARLARIAPMLDERYLAVPITQYWKKVQIRPFGFKPTICAFSPGLELSSFFD